MNTLMIKVVVLLTYLFIGLDSTQGWARELPQTTEYDTIYEDQGTTGQMHFVAPYDMEIVSADLGCSCTGVEYPQGLLKAGESYSISYQINTQGRSGAFTPSIAFNLADRKEPWRLHLEGQVVSSLPSKLHLGPIQSDELPISRHVHLRQIEGQPRRISAVRVEGKGIEATVENEGKTLVLSSASGLTWGDRIIASVEATIETGDKEHTRSIEVRGRVSPRFSLEPQSASFGVGAAQRRQVRQVRVGLPAGLADEPIKVLSACSDVVLDVTYQRGGNNSLVVHIGNASDFPAGTLHCRVELQIGAEQVFIPVLALTR